MIKDPILAKNKMMEFFPIEDWNKAIKIIKKEVKKTNEWEEITIEDNKKFYHYIIDNLIGSIVGQNYQVDNVIFLVKIYSIPKTAPPKKAKINDYFNLVGSNEISGTFTIRLEGTIEFYHKLHRKSGLEQVQEILKNYKFRKCSCGQIISNGSSKCPDCYYNEWGAIVEQTPSNTLIGNKVFISAIL